MFLPGKYHLPEKPVFDYGGAIASFVSLSAFVYMLHNGAGVNWKAPDIITSLIILIISIIYLFYEERKAVVPVIDPALLKNKNFLLCALGSVPSFMITSGLLFLFPFYLEELMKFSVETSGMLIMAIAMGQLPGPYAGSLADKFGYKKILVLGIFLTLLSFALFFSLSGSSGIILIVSSLGLFGISLGFTKAPNVGLALSFVPPEKKGIAAGIMGALRSLGIILGVLFFEIIFTRSISAGNSMPQADLTSSAIDSGLLMKGFHHSFIFGFIICFAAFLMILSVKE